MMEKAREILDVVFRCISKLSDEEIQRIINKEAKLVCVDINRDSKKEVVKGDNVLEICNSIDRLNSREDAYKFLSNNIKKDKLFSIAKHFNVHVLKSYTKSKIIDSIVEGVVGIRVDKSVIKNIDIK